MNLKSQEQQEFEQIIKEWRQSREQEEPSYILRTALEYKGKNLGLSSEIIQQIIKREWHLDEELQKKRGIYESAYLKAIKLDFPVSDNQETVEELEFLQEILELTDIEVATIEKKITTSWDYMEDVRSAKAYLERGLKHYAKGDDEKAIRNYQKAIELKRNYSVAYYNRGLAYFNLRKYEQAIEDYTQAIKINDEWGTASIVETYFARSKAYDKLGTYKGKVIEDLHKAIQTYSRLTQQKNKNTSSTFRLNLGEIHFNLGEIYLDLKNYEAAIENYNNALKTNEKYQELDNAIIYLELGFAYYDSNQKKSALESWIKASELNPNYSLAFYNQGIIHDDNQDYENAIDAYNQAIKVNLEGNNTIPLSDIYYRLGLSQFNLQRFEEAIEAYDQAITIEPEYSAAYEILGDAYQALGKNNLAKNNYQQAAQLYQAFFNQQAYSKVLEKINNLEFARDD